MKKILSNTKCQKSASLLFEKCVNNYTPEIL